MSRLIQICIVVSLGCFISCGSDSDPELDYTGTWDVRYNFSVDGCKLVLPDIPGFVDQHIVENQEAGLELTAVSGLIIPDTVVVREDSSLFATQVLSGDIFGDGSYCELKTDLSYAVPDGEDSESIFTQSIWCDDGYTCESRGIGQASRQPV